MNFFSFSKMYMIQGFTILENLVFFKLMILKILIYKKPEKETCNLKGLLGIEWTLETIGERNFLNFVASNWRMKRIINNLHII